MSMAIILENHSDFSSNLYNTFFLISLTGYEVDLSGNLADSCSELDKLDCSLTVLNNTSLCALLVGGLICCYQSIPLTLNLGLLKPQKIVLL